MILTQHFIDQAIGHDVFGSTTDARRWSLRVVGALGVIGGLAAMLLLPDASGVHGADVLRTFSRPSRIMAVILAMVGSGLLSCAIWPLMVFDPRDVEVLTGLPLSAPRVVKAKLLALSVIVLAFSCGTQLPAAVVFGQTFGASIVTSSYVVVAHLVVQLAAGVFVFLFIAAAQSLALLLLGPDSFLKFSAAVQAALTALIAAAITYAPDLYYGATADLRDVTGPVPVWLSHGPLPWFIGAYDVLLGSRAGAQIQQAVSAAAAVGICLVITLAVYPVMYLRLARIAIEQAKRAERRSTTSIVERVSRRLAHSRTAQAASTFALLSLIRWPRHRQAMAVALGLAAAYCIPSILRWGPRLATPPIRPPAELLSVPFEAIFILVGGLLLAMSLPGEPGSGWIWRATEPDSRALRSATRRVTFLLGVLPVVAIMMPIYWFGWGVVVALWHAAVCTAVGAFVIVVTTIRRRTPPCAWPLPGPGPAPIVIGAWYLGAYYVVTDWFPAREPQILDSAEASWGILAGLVLAVLVTSRIGVGRVVKDLKRTT